MSGANKGQNAPSGLQAGNQKDDRLNRAGPPKKWQEAKEYYLRMAPDEKCKNFQSLSSIPPFSFRGIATGVEKELQTKISLWSGDITKLAVDAIVNAASGSLLGGGGVDGAIHAAAGELLLDECRELHGCSTGDAKVTGGYKLPAKYVIHTVGPTDGSSSMLQRCYQKCLSLVSEHKLKSVAFPCIATGAYGFPHDAAARIAVETTRKWLLQDNNYKQVDRVVFCTFLPLDMEIYSSLLISYFFTAAVYTPKPYCTVPSAYAPLLTYPGRTRDQHDLDRRR